MDILFRLDLGMIFCVVPALTGVVFPQQAKVENLQRLYEIDDHPERRAWLDKLLSFMEERGTPISQCPTISKNPLDLYRLYIFTKDRGGFLEVGAGRGVPGLTFGINFGSI